MTESSTAGGAPSAAIISVGDELLLGQTLDTNGSWLSERLTDMGFQVLQRLVVPDSPEAIAAAVTRSLKDVRLTVVTGGLGPTPDDLTRDAVADGLGVPLVQDDAVYQRLEERARTLGLERVPEGTERMALVPLGAEVIPNALGAAPGLVLTVHGNSVVLLPGIPREMRGIFSSGVGGLLSGRFSDTLRPAIHRTFHTSGIPESRLAEEIGRILPEETGPVSIAFLPHIGGVRIRLTARGLQEGGEADVWLDRVQECVEPVLLAHRYEADSGDLAEALGRVLSASGLTLAVAESCTGGLIAKSLTDHPGSSAHFMGGIVAYSNSVKTGSLGIPRALLDREGAVSGEVALAMAQGVARVLGADAGIGVTGVAGPGGGTVEKPVGTVWYAASLDGVGKARTARFLGDRRDIRARASWAALLLLLRMVEGRTR